MVALLLLLLLSASEAAAQRIDTLALRAHTRFLADDLLQGRGTGTPGERLAALYIESQLRKLGVNPVNGTYQQAVPLKVATILAATMAIRSGAVSAQVPEHSFIVSMGGADSFRDFEGRTVFAGTLERAHALAAADLRDRVIVTAGSLGAAAAQLVPRWLEAGAAGLVVLVPDSAQFEMFARSRGAARFFVDAPVHEPVWQSALPTVIAGPQIAHMLLRDPNTHVAVTLKTETQAVRASNVIGVIPGTDPVLRSEYVLYTAHYDHLGIAAPDQRGDSIYNGFSDNAAGVAMLLAIAQELVRKPSARSVAFLFFTGEERGLLGSAYYTARPLIALEKTAAVLNLDAGAPPAPPVEWRLAGGTANTIGLVAREVAGRHAWKMELSDATPNSDYWPFHARGLPAVFLIPGNQWENVTTAQRTALRARWDRYHRADDEWAEDFPFRGLQRYAELALELGTTLADRPERPTFRAANR